MGKFGNTVNVALGILATLVFVAGFYQSLALSDQIPMKPILQGYIGGLLPLLAGVFGTVLMSRAFKEGKK